MLLLLLVSFGSALQLFSPAKVNLFLRVLGKREDGFHELASLFQAVDLGDRLELLEASEDSFWCNIPLPEENLVTRALKLYQERTGCGCFEALLHKETPVEAGLGGGSSNAATALWGANLIYGKATEDELVEWSKELGSDITFFLGPTGTAYCTGRGEILEPLPPLDARRLVVVKPVRIGLSTPAVFEGLAASDYKTLSDRDPKEILDSFVKNKPVPVDYVNDLEPPAFELEPRLLAIKTCLLDYCAAAMMSGSGTSIFGVLDEDQEVDEFEEDLRDACKDMGVPVDVFKVAFLPRTKGGWYDDELS